MPTCPLLVAALEPIGAHLSYATCNGEGESASEQLNGDGILRRRRYLASTARRREERAFEVEHLSCELAYGDTVKSAHVND